MTIVFTWQGEENLLWTLVWWWWWPLWWLRSSPQWSLKSEVLRFPLMEVGWFPEGKVGEQWSKFKQTKKKHTQINTNTSTKKPRADRHSPPRCHCRCHYRFHRHFRFHCHCHFHCHFPLEYKMLNIEYKKLPLPLPLSSRIQNMKYKKANMICDMSLWMQNKEYKC